MIDLTTNARTKLIEPNFAYLATVMPDGSPQVTPMWIDLDDEGYVLFNTCIGRVKDRNLRRDPRVALSIGDRDNQYNKLEIRGEVVEFIEGDVAERHIDKLAQKYLGHETYQWREPGQQRMILRVSPSTLTEQQG